VSAMTAHSAQGDSFGCKVERELAMLFDTTTSCGSSIGCEFDGAAHDGAFGSCMKNERGREKLASAAGSGRGGRARLLGEEIGSGEG
jgi:hypothetical protein